MPLKLEAKEAIVVETREVAQSAISTVVADYRGMTVAEVTELRKQARHSGIRLSVIRNTLAKRAFEGTDYACLDEALRGPTMLGFSFEDPGAGARLFRDYARQCPALEVKALSLNGELYGAEDLAKVASLPTREEALAQLLSVMKAPIAKIAQTLHAVPAKLVRTLAALKDQQAASDA
ncbi:MAG: 50S ribosomal protein L10 [Gammaproteobacteria bacterium]|nr:50S ribosomal protein L10 [Gammaproteobacteria bacterium]